MSDEGTATRWLGAEEQRVWRTYLEATALLAQRLAADLDASAHGLSMPEYELLVRLSESPDRSVRMSDLADGLVHSRSRLTHAIARMEERGLVERRTCEGDRRGVLATMTGAGWAALVAAAPVHVAGVREHLFDQLSEQDAAALGRITSAVAAHLRPEAAPCPGPGAAHPGAGPSAQPT